MTSVNGNVAFCEKYKTYICKNAGTIIFSPVVLINIFSFQKMEFIDHIFSNPQNVRRF